MAMDATTQIARLQEFFTEFYQVELLEAIREGKDFLVVNFEDLAAFDPELGNMLIEEPENTIKACEIAVEQMEGKSQFTVRFGNLPPTQCMPVRVLRAKHLAKFVQLTGIVRQKSDVRPQVTTARFECPSCGNTITVIQVDTKFREPDRCGCGRKGKFRLLSKELVDAQRIVLEESPDDLEGGEQPKRLNIFLRKDLVAPITDKRTNPGSKVMVTGYLKEVPQVLHTGGTSTRYDLMLETNYIEPVEEDYSQITINPEEEEEILALSRDPEILKKLVSSLAPGVYGHDRIKEAIVLQMLGGVKKKRSDGFTVRGDMHVLLVGDPGSGKSSLLKRSQEVAPKSRFVSGKGTSAAGLTASVVRDEFLRGWALEAGALVLANKGFCVTQNTQIRTETGLMRIDELHKEFFRGNRPKVFSVDYASLSIVKKGIANISVRDADTSKIALESGDVLEATGEHPILVWDNGYSWKQMRGVKVGDHIFTKRTFPMNQEFSRIIDYMPENTFVSFPVKEHFPIENNARIARELGIAPHRLWSYNKLTLGDIQKLCTHYHKSYEDIRKKIVLPDLPSIFNEDIGELTGLLASDGRQRKTKNGIVFHSVDDELIKRYVTLFERTFSVKTSTYAYGKQKRVYASSRNIHQLFQQLGIVKGNKSTTAMDFAVLQNFPSEFIHAFFCGYLNGDGTLSNRESGGILTIVNGNKETLQSIQKLIRSLGIFSKISDYTSQDGGVLASAKFKQYTLNITGVYNLSRIHSHFLIGDKKNNLLNICKRNDLSFTLPKTKKLYESLNSQIPYSEKKVLDRNGVRISELDKYGISQGVFERTTRELAQMNPAKYTDEVKLFEKILDEDMVCLRVTEKKALGVKTVYNLQIDEPNHPNFIANNMITHNCMIDELDKMSPEDRSAFHEALESQTVTISKANIQATLRAETVVLAAANPKFGRFDPYELLAKQIELPSTLINRFDLIFPVRDLPSEEKDRKLAEFVLKMHKTMDVRAVEIETEVLTKYISYARGRCMPRLTDEAIDAIQKFYVDMRNAGSDGGDGISAIPISARQLEALVRMSEASARSRLAKEVLKSDAERAIDLLMYCLQQLGVDPDSGKLDIDRLTTGVTASQRSQVHVIKEIIRELADVTGDPLVSEEDILARANEKGIKEDKAEETLEKLNRLGDIFRPKPGYYSMMK